MKTKSKKSYSSDVHFCREKDCPSRLRVHLKQTVFDVNQKVDFTNYLFHRVN